MDDTQDDRADTTHGFRWAPIPEDLLYDPDITPLAVRVYGVLIRHGIDPESCYPSHGRIAERLGVSRRSIQRPIRELEEAGWIERRQRFDASGARISDGYHLRDVPDPTALKNAHPPRAGARTPHVEEREAPALNNAEPPRSNFPVKRAIEREPLKESARAAELDLEQPASPGFDEWWALYPKKFGKRKALDAWAKATRRADPETIIAALREHVPVYERVPRSKIPYPTTWLNGDRWEQAPEDIPVDIPQNQTPSRRPNANNDAKTELLAQLNAMKGNRDPRTHRPNALPAQSRTPDDLDRRQFA